MSADIRNGAATLGIELGSTRIKACMIGETPADVLAVGSHAWENSLQEGLWTYSLEDAWAGVQAAYADLIRQVAERYGDVPTTFRAIGISGMMHGYLAFDASDELLVPFRTWRNTNTVDAAALLVDALVVNIPLRWSAAHYFQAALNREEHVTEVAYLTTLAGYVHWQLTGKKVLGVGDASGMFPIDPTTQSYDAGLLERFDALAARELSVARLGDILPTPLLAGTDAGTLTAAGAARLDPTGTLQPGIRLCPPEGDAGTGMVATNAVVPRTGNVSAGTSIFAMIVLERPLTRVHEELDLVTTPAGSQVVMVHSNNGASEIAAWAGVFARFAEAAGTPLDADTVFSTLLTEALSGEPDAGGVVAYNTLAAEPVAHLDAGRPLILRTPDSDFTLANIIRAHVFAIFAPIVLGMETLDDEDVALDMMYAHGGVFRTAGVAQGLLAAALNAPVAVDERASEGGAWGIAVLARFAAAQSPKSLGDYLAEDVFADVDFLIAEPDPSDVAGFARFMARYRPGLAAVKAAADTVG